MADAPGQWVSQLAAEGASATEGLRRFREAGGRIRTQTWYRAWGNVVASLARRQTVAAAPLGRRPAADELSQWITSTARGYAAIVEAQVRPVGTSEVFNTFVTVRSDRLLRYGEFLEQGLDYLTTGMEEYGEVVLGGFVSSVNELVPEE